MLPIVAVVGRQNVGKSSLVNALARMRLSIVDAAPGVTRDRTDNIISYRGRTFNLVDTGGIGLEKGDFFHDAVDKQIQFAIDQADLILFLVSVQDGVTELDRRVARRLRKSRKEILLVGNKADTLEMEKGIPDLFELGFDEAFAVSAVHRRRTGELLELLALKFPERPLPERGIRVAVVGKRNVGKSTFINGLAGEERVIVSELAGTTRDSVDVKIERGGKIFTLIDTAGLRKKGKAEDSVELFSRVRTEGAIKRADVVLFMIEVQRKITEVDKRIASLIEKEKKPCAVLLNKWDLIPEGFETHQFVDYLAKAMPLLRYAPVGILSAVSGKKLWDFVDMGEELYHQASARIPTRELNDALNAAQKLRTPSGKRGKLARIYYAAQRGILPPRFIVFCNDPRIFAPDYIRYLEGKLREFLPFPEVPIWLELKPRKRKRKRS
jgi:GTP-binding protein